MQKRKQVSDLQSELYCNASYKGRCHLVVFRIFIMVTTQDILSLNWFEYLVMFTGTRSALIKNRFPMKYVLVRWPVQLARAGVGGT
ncbi:hypothetical protein [Plebeiibacterium sediminum]|uniref:Uncharacterized protein n=1 Tax=Plebeiibacterium sediminum TaxID=2992112 RepID=A0AAE3SHV2_9BACT|nr:hypothetical protein [Plebeiobacterium sediminum]MCW3789662.1 hypothetical protein [Plebeiobacterium sediminum]